MCQHSWSEQMTQLHSVEPHPQYATGLFSQQEDAHWRWRKYNGNESTSVSAKSHSRLAPDSLCLRTKLQGAFFQSTTPCSGIYIREEIDLDSAASGDGV